MKGISTIIATILLVVITIGLISTVYLFMSGLLTGMTSKVITLIHAKGHMVIIRNDGTDTVSTDDLSILVEGKEAEIANPQQIKAGDSVVLKFVPPELDTKSARINILGASTTLSYTTDFIPHEFKVDSDTIALWHFDGNANDYAGDNHGTLWWDADFIDDCMFGSCLTLDGTNDCVVVGDMDALDMGTSDFTIGAWVKTTDPSSNTIVSKHAGGNYPGYHLEIDNGRINLRAGDGTNEVDKYRGFGYNDDDWHFIVLTFDHGNVAKAYADGSQVGLDIDVSALGNLNNDKDFMIGAFVGFVYDFNGEIDEVVIYNRVLSPEEILDSIYG